MIDSLYIGATGMHAQQVSVDAIANNLANMNTDNYKASQVVFEDLVTQGLHATQFVNAAGVLGSDPHGGTGLGVGIARNSKSFVDGDMKQTNQPMDLAIRGDGFLEVTLPDSTNAYIKGGTLKVNQDGLLSTQEGYPLSAMISVPADTQAITIAPDGGITVQTSSQSTPMELGRLDLVRFSSTDDLTPLGDSMYQPSAQSGDPIVGRAGEDGMGVFAQGFVEASNVQLTNELVNLMVAQRAYEASSKIIQASDDMMGMINNLRR